MSGNEKLRVALVGGAHIHAPGFIDTIKKRDDVSVVAVWDHDEARAARRAESLGCPVVADLNTIWEDASIPLVFIYSETDRHLDLITAAASAGKHVFAEKPLGVSAADSFRMAAALNAAGVLFTTGYFQRLKPEIRFLKQQIDAGAFGTITRVRSSTCHNGSLGGWFDTEWRWMADPKVAGVGAFGDLGTHGLDILMYLCGPVKSVAADIRPVTHRYGDCDETGEALLEFESGVIGTLAAGWLDVDNPVTLLVSGTEGHAAIVQGNLFFRSEHVDGADGKEPWTDLPEAWPHPIEQIVNAAQGKPFESLIAPDEAASRVAVMEAAYTASERKAWAPVTKA
jgi:predicted dehydrogenase